MSILCVVAVILAAKVELQAQGPARSVKRTQPLPRTVGESVTAIAVQVEINASS
jgi:hypothetical protein